MRTIASELEGELIAVSESSAIAAAQTMGFGDRELSHTVALGAMNRAVEKLAAGRIRIGKGDSEQLPFLYVGGEVGTDDTDPAIDLAVDPLEGAEQCATGAPGAVAVMAASERDGLLRVPEARMEKIIVGPTARGVIHLDAPVPENLRNIARAFGRDVSELTVVVLASHQHEQLIADIRSAGARIRLSPSGNISAGISAAVRGTGVHAVVGTGAAPQAVIVAAALRCLGGEIQARIVTDGEAEPETGGAAEFPSRIFDTRELAPGEDIVFSCTGVTDGELLRGVRYFGGGTRTSTLFMTLRNGTIRFVDTIRREDLSTPVHFR